MILGRIYPKLHHRFSLVVSLVLSLSFSLSRYLSLSPPSLSLPPPLSLSLDQVYLELQFIIVGCVSSVDTSVSDYSVLPLVAVFDDTGTRFVQKCTGCSLKRHLAMFLSLLMVGLSILIFELWALGFPSISCIPAGIVWLNGESRLDVFIFKGYVYTAFLQLTPNYGINTSVKGQGTAAINWRRWCSTLEVIWYTWMCFIQRKCSSLKI